jgi:Transposase
VSYQSENLTSLLVAGTADGSIGGQALSLAIRSPRGATDHSGRKSGTQCWQGRNIGGGVRRIDWAEGHHDIALIDGDGKLIAKRRISESVDGVAELTAMLTAAGDSETDPIPVAIETPRGLLVAVLRATGPRQSRATCSRRPVRLPLYPQDPRMWRPL